MTYYAINGSPRKTHNTATILNKALEGVKAAESTGANGTDPSLQPRFFRMRELFRVQAPRREKLRQMRRPGRFDADSGAPRRCGRHHLRLARLFPQHYRQDAYVLRKAPLPVFRLRRRLFRAVPETDAHGVRLHHERALPSHAREPLHGELPEHESHSFRGCSPSPKPSM